SARRTHRRSARGSGTGAGAASRRNGWRNEVRGRRSGIQAPWAPPAADARRKVRLTRRCKQNTDAVGRRASENGVIPAEKGAAVAGAATGRRNAERFWRARDENPPPHRPLRWGAARRAVGGALAQRDRGVLDDLSSRVSRTWTDLRERPGRRRRCRRRAR